MKIVEVHLGDILGYPLVLAKGIAGECTVMWWV